jgi:hypothetical protein
MSYTPIDVTHHGISELKELWQWQESWNLNPISLINLVKCCILSLIKICQNTPEVHAMFIYTIRK